MSLNLSPLGQLGGTFPFYIYIHTQAHTLAGVSLLSLPVVVFLHCTGAIYSFRLIIQCFAGLVYIARHICTTHWLWSNLFFFFVSCSFVLLSYSYFPTVRTIHILLHDTIPYYLVPVTTVEGGDVDADGKQNNHP